MMSPHDKRCIARRALKRSFANPVTHTGKRVHPIVALAGGMNVYLADHYTFGPDGGLRFTPLGLYEPARARA